MPTITDWLMVGITAVYVIATILICWANIKASEATRNQLVESKRQHAATQRLSVMPVFQADVRKEPQTEDIPEISFVLSPLKDGVKTLCSSSFVFILKNIGFGSAKEIQYSWDGPLGHRNRGDYPIKAIFPNDSGETLVVAGIAPEDMDTLEPIYYLSLFLRYKDLLDNIYEQEIILRFYLNFNLSYQGSKSIEIADCKTKPAVQISEQST